MLNQKNASRARELPIDDRKPPPQKASNRLPAPTLFVGPPSRNASSSSLASPPARAPLTRQRSHLATSSSTTKESPGATAGAAKDNASSDSPATATGGVLSRHQAEQQRVVEAQSAEKTDALWLQMQNTLEEVELSALNAPNVFGPKHSKALDELRMAQIQLAQAWARGEGGEGGEGGFDDDGFMSDTTAKEREQHQKEESQDDGDALKTTADVLASDRREKLFSPTDAKQGPGNWAGGTTKTQLETDTEQDIALARKRREANDRYFQRVNEGVLDVVSKLETVAQAMKGVELESKEIWGSAERDSLDSYSNATGSPQT